MERENVVGFFFFIWKVQKIYIHVKIKYYNFIFAWA